MVVNKAALNLNIQISNDFDHTGVYPKVKLDGIVTLVVANPVTSCHYNSLSSVSFSLSNAKVLIVYVFTVSSLHPGKSCMEESRSRYHGLQQCLLYLIVKKTVRYIVGPL